MQDEDMKNKHIFVHCKYKNIMNKYNIFNKIIHKIKILSFYRKKRTSGIKEKIKKLKDYLLHIHKKYLVS